MAKLPADLLVTPPACLPNWKISGKVDGQHAGKLDIPTSKPAKSDNFGQHFLLNLAETSRKPRGNLAETSRKPCGNLAETSRKARGNLAETSRKPRGNLNSTLQRGFREVSARFPRGFCEVSARFPQAVHVFDMVCHGALPSEMPRLLRFCHDLSQLLSQLLSTGFTGRFSGLWDSFGDPSGLLSIGFAGSLSRVSVL